MIADRRLCLTADRSEVVEENDPRAAWLLAGVGRQLGAGAVERYGLYLDEDERVRWGVKAMPKPEDKMAPAPANKAAPAGLPEDFPGRDKLIEAGHETIEAVRQVEDLTAVDGIGKATAARIEDYLAREE